jgi:TPP-dependent pyruvate/acetoin dehydrogenase alpha subunit
VEADDLSYNSVNRETECPIRKLEGLMLKENLASAAELSELTRVIEAGLDSAIEFAKASPFPDPAQLVTEV